jgi:hypothetical protein
MVAVGDGVLQGLEQHRADSAAKNCALANGVEGAAVPVQGMNVAFFRQVSFDLGNTYDRTSCQHHVALIESEVLARLMDRQQGRRAR